MASATKQTKARRKINKDRAGRANKKARAKRGTPKFPIHPDKA
ncbi:MAG: hypothetical protein R3A78_11535 [Polyangiales bacterium]